MAAALQAGRPSAASRGEAGVPRRRDGEAVEPELRDVLAKDVDAPDRLRRPFERCLGAVRYLADEGWVDRVAQHVLAVDGLHFPLQLRCQPPRRPGEIPQVAG